MRYQERQTDTLIVGFLQSTKNNRKEDDNIEDDNGVDTVTSGECHICSKVDDASFF